MNSDEEKIRAAIAEQAGEWFVANGDGPLDAADAAALTAWFKASPVHIEEFLGVSTVARELQLVHTDPQFSVEAILARARAEETESVHRLWPQAARNRRDRLFGAWLPAAVAAAACALVVVAVLLRWNPHFPTGTASPVDAATVHFATRHGEQLTQRLADNSVLHLNTDSAVSIRYGNHQRYVELTAGQASFDVVHDSNRVFRVRAGSAEITDLGTTFDVRLDDSATVVTVVAGRVAVGRSTSGQALLAPPVELGANQQLRVGENAWPAQAVTVDATRSTSWVQGKLTFDNETLERVAAEFNRYTSKPIEIATPGLRRLRISGVFATDDTDAFIAFLRSLKGVRVEVTDTHILVSGE